jgi:hypothetical protein
MKYNIINFIKRIMANVFGLLLMLSMVVMSVPAQKWTSDSEQVSEGREEVCSKFILLSITEI